MTIRYTGKKTEIISGKAIDLMPIFNSLPVGTRIEVWGDTKDKYWSGVIKQVKPNVNTTITFFDVRGRSYEATLNHIIERFKVKITKYL